VEAYGGRGNSSTEARGTPDKRLGQQSTGRTCRFVSSNLRGCCRVVTTPSASEFIGEVGIPRSAEITAIQQIGNTVRMVGIG
jgi:hypothetical protein